VANETSAAAAGLTRGRAGGLRRARPPRRALARVAPLAAVALCAAFVAAPAAPAVAATAGAADVVATGVGDAAGYHLYTASAAGGWTWTPLATLAPGGLGDDSWVGYQCVTGDGRYVVAVTAPRHVANDPAGRDHGASAYSVDVRTGAVAPLAGGVALMYFNPGCGEGHLVALSRYLGADEAETNVLLADAASGTVRSSAVVPGEVVSNVPTGTGVAGVDGNRIVDVHQDHVSVRVRLPGRPYMLRPGGAGLDVLVAQGRAASLYGVSLHSSRRYTSGSLYGLALYQGAGGRNVVLGAPHAPARFRVLEAPRGGVLRAASLRGSVALSDPPRVSPGRATGAAAAARYVPAQTQSRLSNAAGRVIEAGLPASPAGAVTTVPRTPTARPTGHVAVNSTSPVCSVPRNDPTRQVPQPNAAQVDWAIQQAVRGNLSGGVLTRPANFLNMGLGAYSPSIDLPPVGLNGHAGVPVPRSVVDAVLTSATLNDPAAYKVRSQVTVDFLQTANHVVDPSSISVHAQAYSGDTHFPDFVLSVMPAYQKDYGIPIPNLSYAALNLHQYSGAMTAANPAVDGIAPGRAYKPYLEPSTLTDGGTCVRVKEVSGGTLGYKPMVLNASVRSAADAWRDNVKALVQAGTAPQAVLDGANAIHDVFFKKPVPATLDGNSPFYLAPAIWIEQDAKFCADGSIRPGDGVNIADSSYMPDLYLFRNNNMIGLQGQGAAGPAQTGDFFHFANPGSDFYAANLFAVQDPGNNPWDECTFDPASGQYNGRRNGQPWPIRQTNLPLPPTTVDEDQNPSLVRFCDEQYYPPVYYSDSNGA
jgi:hypothetical protein